MTLSLGKIEASFSRTREVAILVSKQCGWWQAHFGVYTLQACGANTETDVVKYEDLCDHYLLSANLVNGKTYIFFWNICFQRKFIQVELKPTLSHYSCIRMATDDGPYNGQKDAIQPTAVELVVHYGGSAKIIMCDR